MKNINNHLDNGCPSPTPSEVRASMSPSKGKQKQQWTKIFQGSGDGAPVSGSKKGKGRAK